MPVLGMDTEQARSLAQQFAKTADELDAQIVSTLGKQIAASPWKGMAADTFRHQWLSIFAPNVRAVATELRSASETLNKNLAAQEQTSADDGASSSTSTSGSGSSSTDGSASSSTDGGTHGAVPTNGGTPAPASPGNRPSLDDVLRDNQVSDDTMVDWEPGFPFSLATDPKKITAGEASMLDDLWPWQQNDFKDIHDEAFAEADEVFPPTGDPNDPGSRNDNHNDAYRHALWSAKLAQTFGADWAQKYTTAHERIPGNEPQREAMDLHNNNLGIQLVRNNPNASPEEIARMIEDAINNGDAVVVDSNGNLAWSDQVPQGQTGHPADGQPPLPGKDPGEPNSDGES